MMEKKVKTAVGTAVEGNLRKHQQYLPPVVEVLPFALEKGFAVSSLNLHSVGSDPTSKDYAGEKMEDENWGLMKDNQISF